MHDIYDLDNLYEAFLKSMKGSDWKEEPQRFEANFLSELVKLKRELETGTYRTTKGSTFILNERGKERFIHGGRIRDRVVRHSLCDNVLNPVLSRYLIYNNGASQKGKGVSFSRKMFERDLHNFYLKYGSNDGYVAFVDFSKFYDNIQHEKVIREIAPHFDDFTIHLVCDILDGFKIDVSYMTDYEYWNCLNEKFSSIEYYSTIPEELRIGEKFMHKSCDIGDQVSQTIGIFFPIRIDNVAKIVKGCKWYGRYSDDIYIIHKSKEYLNEVIDCIRAEARELGLFINDKKTRIVPLSSTYKYLQVRYSLTNTGRVIKRITPQNMKREKQKLRTYRNMLDDGRMEYPDIENSYKSWYGTYSKLMSKSQKEDMKELYFSLFGRYI